MELSQAQLIAADIVLLKIPPHHALSMYGFVGGNLLVGKQDGLGDMYPEVAKVITSGDMTIRMFLLGEKYIETIDHSIPRDILTDKGIKAQELGGHQQYKTWEAEEMKRKSKELKKLNWPQKYWWAVTILAAALGFFLDIGKDKLLQEKSPKTNPLQVPTPTKVDTVYILVYDTGKTANTQNKGK